MKTKNKYSKSMWDDFYTGERKKHVKVKQSSFFKSYDIFLCDEILKTYLPISEDKKLKIAEIGSGDGQMLRKVSKMFNYEPTGLEYSPAGVQMGLANGVETKLCDIFDENDIQPFLASFDIVFSYGFIEHILPVEKAIIQHLKILKPGGTLVMQIPRLKGFNYRKFRLLRPDLIPLHNLDLMEEEVLSTSCAGFPELQEVVCKNYGTFKIRIPLVQNGRRYYLGKALSYFEYFSNPLLRIFFGKKGCESRWFSPAIIYIGLKKS